MRDGSRRSNQNGYLMLLTALSSPTVAHADAIAHNRLMLSPKRLPFYYGWIVIAVAFVTMAIGVNARTAFSLLFAPLIDEFGWQRGLTAGAFSFGFATSAVLSPLMGRLMDRSGPRDPSGVPSTGSVPPRWQSRMRRLRPSDRAASRTRRSAGQTTARTRCAH